ncbi:uncharacterized protein LOC126668336 [Mercurialis annua]|uniref:uncharacterized protein LOC126668336 n=1 Tax=Mercurialis annua TaxID=3986 RepID=UPI00215E2AA5|nr:uncharacterized protein LOC126668336 [Mercurialis annua]
MPRPSYMKPYPDWIDKLYPFPRGYKVPEFSLFSGEERGQSTIEHVARFLAQCDEAAAHDFWKLRLFVSSLTKMAFTWYSRLTPKSIETWKDLEILFHEEFYRAPLDVTLADLARISQLPSKSAEKYIDRFINLRRRCSTKMSEADCVLMVVRGMSFAMREHFEGHRFWDLFELTNRVKSYESFSRKKSRGEELPKITLSEGHVIPPPEKMVGKDYYKYHNSWRHSTDNCVNFRNVIQKAINEGELLFPAKKEADAKYIQSKWSPRKPKLKVETDGSKWQAEKGRPQQQKRKRNSSPTAEVTCPSCSTCFAAKRAEKVREPPKTFKPKSPTEQ